MNILGIGGYSHDAAAALVVDGELVAAVAEERLSRLKHQGGIPRLAVDWCLAQAGLRMEDVDHIGAYMQPGERLRRRLGYRMGQFPRYPLNATAFAGYEILHNLGYIRGLNSLRRGKAQLHYMPHHPAHAASAFLASPFERSALLSIDYVGEFVSTWTGVGEGNDIRPLQSWNYPHSLGVFYSAITDYLGFLRASDEYKVMGLASYGAPEYYEDMKQLLHLDANGGYAFDLSWVQWHFAPGSRCGYFSQKFLDRYGPPRKKDEPVTRRHENIAASAQKLLEETVLHLAHGLHQQSGCEKLCLAGGVALNCAMNGRLLREGAFTDIWVQPAAGDDGIAVGAALQLHQQYAGGPRTFEMSHAQYGPEYGNAEIKAALDARGMDYRREENIASETAELLAAGKIVGWYQGRMEFGPRALGNRSILADPTRPDMKDRLNARVKFREEFRPFAPSVLEEKAGAYFEGCTQSPYMLFVYPVRAEKRAILPAITHVDGTARVQTVCRETNPRYYALIEEFEKRRGVPVLVNTSFNVMGEPIVNTPDDAIRCFENAGIDALAMGDYLLVK